jgi:hypothetical protein
MDPLHLAIALSPLAIYLVALGAINLAGRPIVTSGARDAAALGVAVSGFAVAGPMELFMPQMAAAQFGGYVWLLLLALYFVSLTLVVMLLRPRIVIYNAAAEEIQPVLGEIALSLDAKSHWAGDCLAMPEVGVQLTTEEFAPLRNVQLVATGGEQNLHAWRHLEIVLGERLAEAEGAANPHALSLLLLGAMMIVVVAVQMFSNQPAVAQALRQMLQL